MTRVAVVGGGITGLQSARLLARAGCSVTLLEASGRLGGKLAPVILDGAAFDSGAESVLARRPEAVALIDDLGLGADRVHPTAAKARLLIDGRPVALPPSLMGVPTDVDALRDVLSPAGLERAGAEPKLAAPPLSADVAFGAYVDRRFGAEVTDRLVEPLLGGVYAGNARELSFEAVAQALFSRARAGGSLLDHARSSTGAPGAGPVFAGVAGGVHRLVDALVAELDAAGVEVRLDAPVEQFRDGRLRLVGGESLAVDGLLVAAPARTIAPLLGADALGEVAYASVAVVTLVVRGIEPDGSGLLVPRGGLPTIKALTHSTRKWDWAARRAEDVWGEGTHVIRASVGRIGEAAVLQLDDEALLARTWSEATGRLPGWGSAELVTGRVTRWGGALPQYAVGHRDRVAALRRALEPRTGIAVAGAALDGVGIAACLGSATAAVAKITTDLGGPA